jgi:hypothetical protein
MHSIRNAVVGALLLLTLPLVVRATTCRMQPLLHQRRDVQTIERLERAWTLAYLLGDMKLEQCLLTVDFTEIMRTGDVKVLTVLWRP